MNRIRLHSLELQDYKAIAHQVLQLNGADAIVYGKNGAGKSTLASAFLWALTGKDVNGRADYQIKPLDETGSVQRQGMEPTVTAVLSLPGGEVVKLTRKLVEKWATARGRSEKEYKGDETRCYIDDVPKTVTEYSRFITENLAPEPVLRLLTSTGYFTAQIDNNARRKLLFDTFGELNDSAILAGQDSFAPLREQLGRRSVPEFQKVLEEQRKRANAEVETLPIRIDEAQQQIVPVDSEAARQELSQLNVTIAQKRYALNSGESNPLLPLEQEVAACTQRIAEAKANGQRRLQEQEQQARRAGEAQQAAARRAVTIAEQAVEDADTALARKQAALASTEQELEAARAKWKQLNATPFLSTGICPTCQQPYEPDMLREMEANWNEAKAQELEQLTEAGQALSRQVGDIRVEVGKLIAERNAAHERLQQAQESLLAAMAIPGPPTSKSALQAEIEAEHTALQKQLEDAELALSAAREAATDCSPAEALRGEIQSLEARQQELQKILLQEEQNQAAQERVKQHQERHRQQLSARDDAERLLNLCDEFTRKKVGLVSDHINSHFQLVVFRLFDNQKNGGLKLVCEATVDGVPFEALNRARRVAASLDIINTFSEAHGISLPVFIDDAEGVYERYGISSDEMQTITLYATEADEQLRVELQAS